MPPDQAGRGHNRHHCRRQVLALDGSPCSDPLFGMQLCCRPPARYAPACAFSRPRARGYAPPTPAPSAHHHDLPNQTPSSRWAPTRFASLLRPLTDCAIVGRSLLRNLEGRPSDAEIEALLPQPT